MRGATWRVAGGELRLCRGRRDSVVVGGFLGPSGTFGYARKRTPGLLREEKAEDTKRH